MDFNRLLVWSKEFALVWFFLAFLGILFWVLRPANRDRFEQSGRIPLDDDEDHP